MSENELFALVLDTRGSGTELRSAWAQACCASLLCNAESVRCRASLEARCVINKSHLVGHSVQWGYVGFCVYLINAGQCYSSFGERHEWMSKCKRELLAEKGRVPVCVQIFNTSRAPSSSLCHRSVGCSHSESIRAQISLSSPSPWVGGSLLRFSWK